VTVSVNVDRLLSLVRHTHKFLSRVVNHSDGCVAIAACDESLQLAIVTTFLRVIQRLTGFCTVK